MAARPLDGAGGRDMAELLDHHCCGLLDAPEQVELWCTLSDAAIDRDLVELRTAISARRAAVLAWATSLIGDLQTTGQVTSGPDPETIAAVVLLALDGLTLTARTAPAATRTSYDAIRTRLLLAYATPVTATGQA